MSEDPGARAGGGSRPPDVHRRFLPGFIEPRGDPPECAVAADVIGDSAHTVSFEDFTAAANGSDPEYFEVRSTHLLRSS